MSERPVPKYVLGWKYVSGKIALYYAGGQARMPDATIRGKATTRENRAMGFATREDAEAERLKLSLLGDGAWEIVELGS